MTFKDKIVLVTGASRGIGRAIAETFAAKGAVVVGTATTEAGAAAISSNLEKIGQGFGIEMNVAQQASIEQAFEKIVTKLTNAPQIVVNNAGITRDNLMLRMKPEEWDEVINTNLTGLYRITKLCLKSMIKARWGRIINISSIVGVNGNAGQANYAAAKAGLIGFSKSVAQEVASRNVTVNVVAPGYIQTDMTNALGDETKAQLLKMIPMQKVGRPEDIAEAVLFLASEAAGYITGQTLHVNGGMYMN